MPTARKFVQLECGHQREVGVTMDVGSTMPCSECGYADRRIARVLPIKDNRRRWSDEMR